MKIEEKADDYVAHLPYVANYEEDDYDSGFLHGAHCGFIDGVKWQAEQSGWRPISELTQEIIYREYLVCSWGVSKFEIPDTSDLDQLVKYYTHFLILPEKP